MVFDKYTHTYLAIGDEPLLNERPGAIYVLASATHSVFFASRSRHCRFAPKIPLKLKSILTQKSSSAKPYGVRPRLCIYRVFIGNYYIFGKYIHIESQLIFGCVCELFTRVNIVHVSTTTEAPPSEPHRSLSLFRAAFHAHASFHTHTRIRRTSEYNTFTHQLPNDRQPCTLRSTSASVAHVFLAPSLFSRVPTSSHSTTIHSYIVHTICA